MKNNSTETTEITNLNETETRPSYTSKAGSPTSYRLEPCAFFAHRDSLTSASPSVRTGVMECRRPMHSTQRRPTGKTTAFAGLSADT